MINQQMKYLAQPYTTEELDILYKFVSGHFEYSSYLERYTLQQKIENLALKDTQARYRTVTADELKKESNAERKATSVHLQHYNRKITEFLTPFIPAGQSVEFSSLSHLMPNTLESIMKQIPKKAPPDIEKRMYQGAADQNQLVLIDNSSGQVFKLRTEKNDNGTTQAQDAKDALQMPESTEHEGFKWWIRPRGPYTLYGGFTMVYTTRRGQTRSVGISNGFIYNTDTQPHRRRGHDPT